MRLMSKVFVVFFTVLVWISISQADELPMPKVDYSADMVMDVYDKERGKMTVEGKIYFSKTKKGDKERREMVMMQHKSIIIKRRDKGVSWVLMPERKMYIESTLGVNKDNEHDPSLRLEEMNVKLTKVGKEKIHGIPTTKYKVIDLDPDGSRVEVFLWLSKDNIQMKMEGASFSDGEKTRFRQELKNLKVGKQDPKLFEVPSNYNKFNVPFLGRTGPGGMPPGGMSEDQIKQMQENMRKQMEEMFKRHGK